MHEPLNEKIIGKPGPETHKAMKFIKHSRLQTDVGNFIKDTRSENARRIDSKTLIKTRTSYSFLKSNSETEIFKEKKKKKKEREESLLSCLRFLSFVLSSTNSRK